MAEWTAYPGNGLVHVDVPDGQLTAEQAAEFARWVAECARQAATPWHAWTPLAEQISEVRRG